jgi:uncharacterized surface anchored protein
MALDQSQRVRVRTTIYILLIVGLIVGAVLFFFGDNAFNLARTLVSPPLTAKTTVHLKLFNDANKNGKQDALEVSEHLVAYADVVLSGAREIKTSTGASGELTASDIESGQYQISATLEGSALKLTPNSVTLDGQTTQDLVIAATTDSALGGFEGEVILDRNRDGIPNDPGLAGVEVQLQLNAQVISQSKSAEDGSFSFNGIAPGMYELVPVLTEAQLKEYKVVSAPHARFEIRSDMDRLEQQLLIKVQPPAVSLGQYRLVQASPTAGFIVSKTGSDADETSVEYVHAKPGDQLSFVITIEPFMATPGAVGSIKVVDTLPSILTPSAINNGGTTSGNMITWNVGSLASGSEVKLSYTAVVSGGAADGYYKNTAVVTGDQAEPADDDTSVVVSREGGRGNGSENPASRNDAAGRGSGSASGNAANTTEAPRTGVEAWALSAVLGALAIAIVSILVAGYRRTAHDRTLQS